MPVPFSSSAVELLEDRQSPTTVEERFTGEPTTEQEDCMAVKQMDIAEFYQQLALLMKANLPLPESLTQLGAAFHKPEFKEVLTQIGAETANGKPLHEAMKPHERYFPKFHRQLIRTGEVSHALPEVLYEVARLAQSSRHLITHTKEILAYPFFAIFFCVSTMLSLLCLIIPRFENIFAEMLAGEPLPPITRSVFGLSRLATTIGGDALTYAMVSLFIFALWLFSGRLGADRLFLGLTRIFPGSSRMADEMDMSRICHLLGIYLGHKMPITEALRQTAELAELPSNRNQLLSWADKISMGSDLKAIIHDQEGHVNPLFRLAIYHSPEENLADELSQLGELFTRRAEATRAQWMVVWHTASVLTLICTVGPCVLAMFMPLFKLIEVLG